jgi:hypothetical protein
MDDELWKKVLEEYSHEGIPSCVNCGSKEGRPLRWKSTNITKLQQGHMDPRKELTYDNCIPQCQFCNQQAKDKFIFNKHGLVTNKL